MKVGLAKFDVTPDHAVPVELDDQSFNDFISQASLPTMVDFFSPTCGPCQTLAPVVDRLAAKYIGRAIIAKLDTSRHPLSASHYPSVVRHAQPRTQYAMHQHAPLPA